MAQAGVQLRLDRLWVPLLAPLEKVLKQADQADPYEVSAVTVEAITIPDLLSKEGEVVAKKIRRPDRFFSFHKERSNGGGEALCGETYLC